MVEFDLHRDVPDLSGRVIVVTGGTDGLGKESVYQLSKHNPAHIYLAARSEEKSKTAIAEIRSRLADGSGSGKGSSDVCPITFLPLDLSSFDSVKAAARQFQSASDRLDLLVCNAGVMGAKGTTKEGYEVCLGVNHVGHALLIKLLLPTLERTATLPDTDVRVVILASEAERFAPKNYALLPKAKTPLAQLNMMQRYGLSKVANIHHAQGLVSHHPTSNIKFIPVHPGTVYTNLGNDVLAGWPTLSKVLRTVLRPLLGLVPVEEGVRSQLWACVSPDAKTGVFYHPVGLEGKGSKRVDDKEMAAELWEWTEKELDGHTVDEVKS